MGTTNQHQSIGATDHLSFPRAFVPAFAGDGSVTSGCTAASAPERDADDREGDHQLVGHDTPLGFSAYLSALEQRIDKALDLSSPVGLFPEIPGGALEKPAAEVQPADGREADAGQLQEIEERSAPVEPRHTHAGQKEQHVHLSRFLGYVGVSDDVL